MSSAVIQLIVLAGIAIFLILRLRNVLGSREGFEKPPVPPLGDKAQPASRRNFEVIEGGPDRDITDHVEEGSEAARALAAMKQAEPSFRVGEFLHGARAAYEMILMAFERGDLASIRPYLADDVYAAFSEVIEARRREGLQVQSSFVGIREIAIHDARFDRDSRMGEVTVRLVGELASVVRNAAGEIVEGNPNEIRRQRDLWTFGRVMGSSDPNWQLVATGGMTVAAPEGALAGWEAEDHAEAFAVFALTRHLLGPGLNADPDGPRAFFERHFQPAPLRSAFFTGYFEPEFPAARQPDAEYSVPVHGSPPDLGDGPWFSRSEILAGDLLAGREIAWLRDPLDAFLLQVQGSGRLRLPDGGLLRLGYAGRNGHPYRSIGAELIRRGAMAEAAMSMAAIRDWAASHPAALPELLAQNPSYVFFQRLDLPENSGPIGSAGVAVTAFRSLATDPAHIPPGTPVWVEIDGPHPLRRLMVAQDTGSAITGEARADIFAGSGEAAGRIAGAMRREGRMAVLQPRRA